MVAPSRRYDCDGLLVALPPPRLFPLLESRDSTIDNDDFSDQLAGAAIIRRLLRQLPCYFFVRVGIRDPLIIHRDDN